MRTFDDIVRGYTDWAIAWRWPVLILCLVIAILASTGVQNLQFTADYKIYFGPKNPQLATFNALENTYTSSDNVFFVIQPQNGTVFTPKNLETE